jgi:hypothetical protein
VILSEHDFYDDYALNAEHAQHAIKQLDSRRVQRGSSGNAETNRCESAVRSMRNTALPVNVAASFAFIPPGPFAASVPIPHQNFFRAARHYWISGECL